jgi:hypothetical protein
LWAKGIGSASRMDVRINLISLGSGESYQCECHRLIHDGKEITRSDVLAVVAGRENCLQGEIEQCIWLIKRLPKDATDERIWSELSGWNDGERRLWERVWDEITGVRS